MNSWYEIFQQFDGSYLYALIIIIIAIALFLARFSYNLWEIEVLEQFQTDHKSMEPKILAKKYLYIFLCHQGTWKKISQQVNWDESNSFMNYILFLSLEHRQVTAEKQKKTKLAKTAVHI